jgi:cell division transport system permease protein
MGFGMLGVWLMPAASDEGGFLTGLGFQGWGWLLPLDIPVLGALVAYVATTRAANKRLGELT